MNIDQKLQLWNAIGTWAAAIATFAAVAVSLFLANRANAVKLKCNAGIRLVMEPEGQHRHVAVNVVNLAVLPVTIQSISWTTGKGSSTKLCVIPFNSDYSQSLPITLQHGETGSFMLSLKKTPDFLVRFSNDFIGENDLRSLRVYVHTSLGKAVKLVPESNLIEQLASAKKTIQSVGAPPQA